MMRVSALLLAGGKSIRMGRDKALLDFDGEPLWHHQLRTLRMLQPEKVLISGSPRKEWEQWETVADAIPDAGPLAGVSAGLRSCCSPLLIVLAIDLPLMTSDYLCSLVARCGEEQGVVPTLAGGFQPLAAVYPRSCLEVAEGCLAGPNFSMHGFVAKAVAAGLIRLQPIRPNELELFTNLNTPADYERTRPRPTSSNP